ncbi:hypothetical protein TNCV_1982471 [Trichonephila clavipes]|nr:hypothetical protein TNCV_1982471 [Trichonephila clavipes]
MMRHNIVHDLQEDLSSDSTVYENVLLSRARLAEKILVCVSARFQLTVLIDRYEIPNTATSLQSSHQGYDVLNDVDTDTQKFPSPKRYECNSMLNKVSN